MVKKKFRFKDLPISEELAESAEEVVLWRAVIDQAVEDAMKPKKEAGGRRDENLDWLRGIPTHDEPHPGFYEVCALAHLHPERVQQQAAQLLEAKGVSL